MTDQELELSYARLRIADHIAKRALACSIDELPTEVERSAARRLVAILAPMSPEERRRVVERYLAREDGERRFREIFGKD